jgi:LDH2 family malate/lactate/ureidoglycolate dehydrogenase
MHSESGHGATKAAISIDADSLTEFVASVFGRAGLSADDAAIVADCFVDAEIRGITTHGVARLPVYIDALRRGFCQARPVIRVHRTSQATAVVDGGDGMGTLVAVRGMREAIALAKVSGIGMVAVHNTNNFGHAGYYAALAAANGCIGIALSNGCPAIAPHGGCQPMLGTNPIAVAAPGGERPDFLLDISSSVVSRGWLRLAARDNEPIPAGLAVTHDGAPARTAQEALSGVLLPFAGHKGSGIAMMIDLLAGVLAGAGFGTHVRSMYAPNETRGDVGHALIAIRISAFLAPSDYERRYGVWHDALKASSPAQGHDVVMIPGERSAAHARKQRREGVQIDGETWQSLMRLAAEFDLRLVRSEPLRVAVSA